MQSMERMITPVGKGAINQAQGVNHRKKRKLEVQQAEKLQQMEIKLKELVSVKDEMLEIKGLLQEVLNKKEL